MNSGPVQNDMPSKTITAETEENNADPSHHRFLHVDHANERGIGAFCETNDVQLSDLRTTNQLLQNEVTDRKRAEKALSCLRVFRED